MGAVRRIRRVRIIADFAARCQPLRGARRSRTSNQQRLPTITEPTRIPRSEHPISRSRISQATLNTLYGLKDAGYQALMVGGGVRDLLAGVTPKDFDVATDATPEQVKAVFGRNCRIIGRRFRIAHVRFGREIIEVSTFRAPISEEHERDESGRILSDNVYGTLETDAFRRDFTINALYYDIRDFSIVDFVGGVEDVRRRVVRLIGDPEQRYREDPVRMLRAVRIAAKLGFRIDPATAEPIPRLAGLLAEVPPARLFEEVLKLFFNTHAEAVLRGLREYGLFEQLFPQVAAAMASGPDWMQAFVEAAIHGTSERIARDMPVTPAFLFAALLWPAVVPRFDELTERQGHPPAVAMLQAGNEVMARQVLRVAIPRRFAGPAQEIWNLQLRLLRRKGVRARRLLDHPRFRAAYDFLLLRARAGEAPQELADFWTEAAERGELPEIRHDGGSGEGAPGKRRKRRRRRRRKSRGEPQA